MTAVTRFSRYVCLTSLLLWLMTISPAFATAAADGKFDSPDRARTLLVVSVISGIVGFVVGRVSARWSLRRR